MISFIIVAFAVFLLIKAINRMKNEQPALLPLRLYRQKTSCCCVRSATASRIVNKP